MKNFKLIFALVATVMLVGLTNCKKDLKDTTPDGKQYVETINASFNVVPAVEITAKAFTTPIPLAAQTMYLYTSNATFYSPFLAPTIPNASYTLVRGLEFIAGSSGQIIWSNIANNPITFSPTSQIIANLVPAENIRVLVEGINGSDKIAYIGANDFNPTSTTFPLSITQYRLGDFLSITTDGMAALGVTSAAISFDTKAIDVPATRIGSFLGANLGFGDIKLGALITNHTYGIPVSGTTTPYSDVLDKIVGNIVITLYVGATTVITLSPIPATDFGHGMHIVLSTAKVGSVDGVTLGITTRTDIDVTTTTVPVN